MRPHLDFLDNFKDNYIGEVNVEFNEVKFGDFVV